MKQERLQDVMTEIPTIEQAASDYIEVRNSRMDLTKKEVAAQERLLATMRAANLEFYRTTSGFNCIVTNKQKVKVSAAKEEAE